MAGWKGVFLLVAALVVGIAVLAAWGAVRWHAATRHLLLGLEASRGVLKPTRYDSARELPGLPEPVQRYFRSVLSEARPMVSAATMEHRGSFNTGQAEDRWTAFTSRQHIVTRRPGFVWDGRVRMAPGVWVHVHDAYVAGDGLLHAAIAGLISVAEVRGSSPEPGGVAHGELMRFFAEAAWAPTALLPSQGVRWEAIDDRHARATMNDGAVSVTLTFTFADDGTCAGVRAEARGRTVGRQVVMTPWEGVWSDYRLHQGLRVPMRGEVAWLTPEGRKPYWRGTVEQLAYEFASER